MFMMQLKEAKMDISRSLSLNNAQHISIKIRKELYAPAITSHDLRNICPRRSFYLNIKYDFLILNNLEYHSSLLQFRISY